MSSMTDIVFLLLIFFIIVSTLVTTNSLNLLLPKKGKPAEGIKNPLVTVSVTESNQVFIDNKQVSLDAVEAQLMQAMGDGAKNGIVLNSDPEASTEAVVQVMDAAQRNDFKIVLTMKPQ